MQDFRALLSAFAPTLASSVGASAFESRSAALFEEAHAINAELNDSASASASASTGVGAGAGDQDEECGLGGVNPDALSPEAFVALCDRYGLVPLRRAGFVAADGEKTSDAAAGATAAAAAAAASSASSPVPSADEAFLPVARPPPVVLRRGGSSGT